MLKKSKDFISLFLLIGLTFSFCVINSYAQEESLSRIANSKYFEVYAPARANLYDILRRVDFFSLRPEQILDDKIQNLNQVSSDVIDAIYLETSDILDIHMYSFRGKIKFLDSAKSVQDVFRKYSGYKMNERSFYFHDKKTIYISLEDATLGMLGHEIAHAIISHYFVVPPSTKVQEVLCGYVDYNLKKRQKRL